MLKNRTIAILGTGTMGEALIRGLLEAGAAKAEAITATARHEDRLKDLATRFHVHTTLDNAAAVRGAEVVVLAVKPKALDELLGLIKEAITPRHTVVSIVAGATSAYIEARLAPGVPVVRSMPNTPCQVRAGVTAVCKGTHAGEAHLAVAHSLFGAIGSCVTVDEPYMDAITGLSASGPAFIFMVIESLAEGGVKVGLPRKLATQLAAHAVHGAGKLALDTQEHPALLKDMVTTPAGCTMDGILQLEEGGLRVTLIKAVVKATQRASELVIKPRG